MAGAQGMRNHHKTDRMLGLAHELAPAGGAVCRRRWGPPGNTDMPIVAGLNNHTFSQFAALSGKVPVVGIAHGRCFAGNAALLGCADVIIATEAANIGMSGPAMIEGGGLGVFKPEEIGPAHVHTANGVIDVLVRNEAEAVATAPGSTCLISRGLWRTGRPPTSGRCAMPCRKTACACTRCAT